jgi:hypothetical protein
MSSVYHRAYDAGAAEVSQVAGAMTALKDMGGQRRFSVQPASRLTRTTPPGTRKVPHPGDEGRQEVDPEMAPPTIIQPRIYTAIFMQVSFRE